MLPFATPLCQAIRLLGEVVRQAPNVPDPYHTMGMVYEEMGEEEKALQFFLIAAHLTPKVTKHAVFNKKKL